MKNENQNGTRPKYLLILPCNKEAKIGDYFQGASWKFVLKKLRDANIDRNEIIFAATDSIITIQDPVNDRSEKGSLVFENEMDRVKGCDIYPAWDNFKKNDYDLLKKHTKALETAWKRVDGKFDLIIVILAVRGYRLSMIRAIRNYYQDQIPENVVIIDGGDSQGWQKKMSEYAARLIVMHHTGKSIPNGIVPIPDIDETNPKMSVFYFQSIFIPEEYQYWTEKKCK